MIGSSIVGAMETLLLGIQATRVMVMPVLALVESGKAARLEFFTCDELRTIIREVPKCACARVTGEAAN